MNEEFKTELKSEGKEFLEDVTVDSIRHVFSFAKKIFSTNTVLIPILESIEEFLIKQADKINGVVGDV